LTADNVAVGKRSVPQIAADFFFLIAGRRALFFPSDPGFGDAQIALSFGRLYQEVCLVNCPTVGKMVII
jgi:hypothetical protein